MPETSPLTCPACGDNWDYHAWLATDPQYPAFTVCWNCTSAAYVDRGPFGYLIRPATAQECDDPGVQDLQRKIREAKP